MLGASFLPARFRSDHGHVAPSNPGYFHRHVTAVLQSIARRAFTHPIHTIVFVALLASTSYVGVLEGSLLDPSSSSPGIAGIADVTSLLEGGRQLRVGEKTGWQWRPEQAGEDDMEKAKSSSIVNQKQSLTRPITDKTPRPCNARIPEIFVQYISEDSATGG